MTVRDRLIPLYHVTQAATLPAIVWQGLQQSLESHRDDLEDDLEQVTEDSGRPVPFDRHECVFLFPSTSSAYELLEPDSAYRRNSLTGHKGIAVVDATAVEADLYLADFQLFSDTIDLQYMQEPDEAIVAKSREDAVRRYAASITSVESPEDLREPPDTLHHPEVVVNGEIPPDAIPECVFVKTLQTRGM